ncbi:hypothetical protein [Flavobacterium caeni]|uniref:Uncharacterized protein n=1 Tax=Flavobacterium caeni TaxID=490189 RepID=A0A1G5H9U4_9FLAO|nr:hypothetical protein [Flavobacterium caeni]SCY60533.1 hypothetical protein SAMN02927903_01828 [Flavobacterium caeni]
MKQIEQLYVNDTGMAFFWREQERVISGKVQLVFKETGFYFTIDELDRFLTLIADACRRNHACESCAMKNKCHKFLLKTPVKQIDLAVSMHELEGIKDLVEGALFKAQLHDYLFGLGRN